MAAKLGIRRSKFYQLVREGRLPEAHIPDALGHQKWDVCLTWLAYLRLIGEERIMTELGLSLPKPQIDSSPILVIAKMLLAAPKLRPDSGA